MYWNTDDGHRFVEGERAGLAASALYAKLALSRSEADAQRHAMRRDEDAHSRVIAAENRFRTAHAERMRFESEQCEDSDGCDDMDEYGYVA